MAAAAADAPSALPAAFRAVATGFAVGCVLGGGAHVAGNGARALRNSLLGAARVGAVLAGYTALREGARAGGVGDALASAGAGAVAVAAPTLASPARVALLRANFANATKGRAGAMPLYLVAASSMLSGALLLGGVDLLVLKPLGARW